MATDLIPSKIWLTRTQVTMSTRSAELKALDRLLADYEARGGGDLRWRVGQALDAWKQAQGAGDAWKKSARNQNGAFDDLTRALAPARQLKPEELAAEQAARDALKDARTAFIQLLFTGRRVQLSAKVLTAYDLAGAAADVDQLAAKAHGAGSVTDAAKAEAKKLVEGLFSDVLHLPEFSELLQQVLGRSLQGLIGAIAPGLGVVKAASETAYNTMLTGMKARRVFLIRHADAGFVAGDPSAAFLALQSMVKDELAESAKVTATYAAETAAKAGGVFLDGGTATTVVVGVAATLGRLVITLNAIREDVLQMNAANRLLENPAAIDSSLFAQCPLLGCYFLACADTSTIVNLMFEDIGKPGFQYEVEQACKAHLEPTLTEATHLILNHRMMLSGGALPKLSVARQGAGRNQIAMRNPSTLANIKASITNKLKGRSGGFHL